MRFACQTQLVRAGDAFERRAGPDLRMRHLAGPDARHQDRPGEPEKVLFGEKVPDRAGDKRRGVPGGACRQFLDDLPGDKGRTGREWCQPAFGLDRGARAYGSGGFDQAEGQGGQGRDGGGGAGGKVQSDGGGRGGEEQVKGGVGHFS